MGAGSSIRRRFSPLPAQVQCPPTTSKWQSLPTEAINPATLALDKASVPEIIDMMVAEDRKVLAAVQKERDRIALGAEIICQSYRRNGRLVFVGAGTSGRLGVLEAAEMPPTFGTLPSRVHAIMAGGKEAVFTAREGVEDDYEEGARAIARLRPTNRDVVVGVSASGITPFVRGALTRARKAGLKIIFVTCWPRTELQNFVDLIIAPAVGPGSPHRLDPPEGRHGDQAGAEHAHDGGHGPRRQDLRQPDGGRADGFGETARPRAQDPRCRDRPGLRRGRQALKRARWNVKTAIVMQKTGLTFARAAARLRAANDSVREAIGEDVEPRLRELLHLDTPA